MRFLCQSADALRPCTTSKLKRVLQDLMGLPRRSRTRSPPRAACLVARSSMDVCYVLLKFSFCVLA